MKEIFAVALAGTALMGLVSSSAKPQVSRPENACSSFAHFYGSVTQVAKLRFPHKEVSITITQWRKVESFPTFEVEILFSDPISQSEAPPVLSGLPPKKPWSLAIMGVGNTLKSALCNAANELQKRSGNFTPTKNSLAGWLFVTLHDEVLVAISPNDLSYGFTIRILPDLADGDLYNIRLLVLALNKKWEIRLGGVAGFWGYGTSLRRASSSFFNDIEKSTGLNLPPVQKTP